MATVMSDAPLAHARDGRFGVAWLWRGRVIKRLGGGMFGLVLAVAGCGAIAPLTARGESSESKQLTELQQKLDQSLKLIEALTQRVKQLEAAQSASAPAAAGAAAPTDAQRIETVENRVMQIEATNAGRSGDTTGVPLHGFADIGIGNHTANEQQFQGANVGALDIFLNPQLGQHTRSLFELTFEVNEQGQVQSDLERAQIGYQFNDQATLWVGRFHTPFGYYNTAYHHGQQIAISLRRPRLILFEDQGGVMPSHTVGAWFTGSEHLTDGKVTYDLFAGNGQSISGGEIDPRSGGVDHGGAIYGGNLGYVFGETLNGLKIGVSAFRSKITDDQQFVNFIRVDNVAVYFNYDTDRFEYVGEYYRFSDTDLTPVGPLHRSSAGFLQLAWRLPFATTPYARYERAVLDQSDEYFALQNNGMSYYRAALGLRFDLDLKSALKFEVARTKNTDRNIQEWNDVLLNYAIRF
jgi:hypothetical protein